MIQRIQSLWLLLAAICAFLSLKFSFYTGNIVVDGQNVLRNLSGIGITGNEQGNDQVDLISILLVAGLGILSLITIFMFANRKTQLRLSIIALIISLAAIAYLIMQTKNFLNGTFSLTSALIFVTPIFQIMAAKGISKDDKLVRSMDRLR